MLCGNEHHVSRRHESGSCTQIVRRPDSGSGRVRATYAFLGMGICFAEIEPDQQLQLKQLLASLAGRSAVSSGASLQEKSMKDTLVSADPRACLDEIAGFFQKNQLLSREEFYHIAKRARRS